MHRMILVSLMLLAILPVGSNAVNAPDQKQKAILVTGARKLTSRHLERYRTFGPCAWT